MKKACLTRAGTVWTLTYRENPNGNVTVLNLDNQDNDGYMFKENLDTLDEIKLGDYNVATHVVINGKEYEVENKQDVFTYKQPL